MFNIIKDNLNYLAILLNIQIQKISDIIVIQQFLYLNYLIMIIVDI